jgi:hypothetical protein
MSLVCHSEKFIPMKSGLRIAIIKNIFSEVSKCKSYQWISEICNKKKMEGMCTRVSKVKGSNEENISG